jgi:membrane protease YdiL (CAAX protease family)
VAILVAGFLHVVTELFLSLRAARLYNVIVVVLFAGYLVWRCRRSEGALRAWGMRADNFLPALRAQLIFGAVGALALLAYGVATDSLLLPKSFWLTVALYPIWGIAQQFALQSLVARNLAGLVTSPIAIASLASALFAASHYPRIELVLLTGVAGVFVTLIYRRNPNLWAAGIVHGILGSLAFYIVLQEDPGAAILSFLTGG